ncbi:MAG: hypothetical protein HC896_17110 [Bacteroidales bacterium]|nr:hypothetical protein [Bacteroidales bacterium]
MTSELSIDAFIWLQDMYKSSENNEKIAIGHINGDPKGPIGLPYKNYINANELYYNYLNSISLTKDNVRDQLIRVNKQIKEAKALLKSATDKNGAVAGQTKKSVDFAGLNNQLALLEAEKQRLALAMQKSERSLQIDLMHLRQNKHNMAFQLETALDQWKKENILVTPDNATVYLLNRCYPNAYVNKGDSLLWVEPDFNGNYLATISFERDMYAQGLKPGDTVLIAFNGHTKAAQVKVATVIRPQKSGSGHLRFLLNLADTVSLNIAGTRNIEATGYVNIENLTLAQRIFKK